jgi:hypothetical protein
MIRQRGIAENWMIGAIALGVMLLVTNALTWHVSAVYTESGWQAREAKINADAAVKIEAANARVRGIELRMAENLASIDARYQTKLKEKDNALTAARAAARHYGLFVTATCPPADRGAAGSTPAGPGIGDGAARVRLSDEAADFLVGEAARADAVVEQLTACQAVVRADREKKPGP